MEEKKYTWNVMSNNYSYIHPLNTGQMKTKTIFINDSNDFDSGTKYMYIRSTNLVPHLEEEEEEVIECISQLLFHTFA